MVSTTDIAILGLGPESGRLGRSDTGQGKACRLPAAIGQRGRKQVRSSIQAVHGLNNAGCSLHVDLSTPSTCEALRPSDANRLLADDRLLAGVAEERFGEGVG